RAAGQGPALQPRAGAAEQVDQGRVVAGGEGLADQGEDGEDGRGDGRHVPGPSGSADARAGGAAREAADRSAGGGAGTGGSAAQRAGRRTGGGAGPVGA